MQRTQSLQWKIGLAFAAAAIGFVAAVAYVPLALYPSARRAEDIQHRYAESVRTLAELRGCEREVRNGAVLAYVARWDPHLDGASQVRATETARERCRSMLARVRATTVDAEELEAWRHFTTVDVPAQEGAADAVLRQAGAAEPDPAVLRELFATAADADGMLETMTQQHAARAVEDAIRIQAGLRRLSLLYVGMTAFGAAGMVALLVLCLRLLRRQARASDERLAALDAFAAQVAHDLRGPLQGIRLTVGLIEAGAPDATTDRLATSAARSVRRLDAMIQDLLQFARSGAERDGAAVADVSAIVRETCEELRPGIDRARVQLTTHADQPALARVTPVAIKTIVANLLENALKYGNPEQDNVVDVRATSDGREVTLIVRDRGIGIPGHVLPHVFEPFVRGARRKDSYGLGLATVKRLVDAHHGTVKVDSEEGRGTTFEIRLPAASGSSLAEPAHPDPVEVRAGRPPSDA